MTLYYSNELVSLYKGECISVIKNALQTKFDLVLTDLPYGKTSCEWDSIINFEDMWDALKNATHETTPIVLFGAEPFSSLLRCSNLKAYKYDWVYLKSIASNFLNAKKQPLRNNELISVFYDKQCVYNPQMEKGTPYIAKQGKCSLSVTADKNVSNGGYVTVNNGERYPVTVTKAYTAERQYHPTQKPVALLEYLIKTYTNKNDIVLDFTSGSGSTGVACINTSRRCVLIEKEEKYCKIAAERLEDAFRKNYYFE